MQTEYVHLKKILYITTKSQENQENVVHLKLRIHLFSRAFFFLLPSMENKIVLVE